jgi:hypothetical protein
MTAPRNGFRAHQNDTLTPGELDAAVEADFERRLSACTRNGRGS